MEVMHHSDDRSSMVMDWLETQPLSSVILISFGSRTAMSKDQIAELAKALDITASCRFVWILKGSNVDKEDKFEVVDLVGRQVLEKIEKKGLVIKGWVNQELILSHRAIGGFLTHSGPNSVMEAAAKGVPLLAWPMGGDQKVTAEVVVQAGLGIWDSSWGWNDEEERLVLAEEIGRKLTELMGDGELKKRAALLSQLAAKAVDHGGSSDVALRGFIDKLII